MVSLLPRKGESPPPEPANVDALRSEVRALRDGQIQRELTALRARVDQVRSTTAELERRTGGGPCMYCGLSRQHAAWVGNTPHMMCVGCTDDRWHHGDLEHKSLIINRIISDDWTVRRFGYGLGARLEIQRSGFRWFCETPDAQPGEWRRWAYLDIPAVRERAAPRELEPPPRFSAGDPCERCGCAYMWTNLPPRSESVGDGVRDQPGRFGCAGCVNIRDLKDVVARVVGVQAMTQEYVPHPIYTSLEGTTKHVDVPERLGVTWFKDRPARASERVRKITYAPFAYLDLDAIRRRAFDMFPFQSQWTAHAAWLALNAEAAPHTQ